MRKLQELLGGAYKEGMTAEEIAEAVENAKLPTDNSAEIERLKAALSKSNSEAADYKKQLRAKMTEDEAAKQKEAEERADLQAKYEALLQENTVAKYKAKLLALGYEEKLADDTAAAMANGETDKVFANQQKHLAAYARSIRAEALKDTPKPTGDGDPKTMTLDKLRKLTPGDRAAFAREHAEEYKALYTDSGTGNE